MNRWTDTRRPPAHDAVCSESRSILIGCLGAKGGQGTSLFSACLSLLLNQGRRTLLVDLDRNSTHRHFLENKGCPGLANLAMVIEEVRPEEFDSFIQKHPCGFDVLPGPRNAEESALLSEVNLRHTFTALSRHFEIIVTDISSNLTNKSLEIIASSSLNFLLMQPDLLSLRGSINVLELLAAADAPVRAETALVVNRSKPSQLLQPEQLASAVQLPLLAVLPHDSRLGEDFSSFSEGLRSESCYFDSLAKMAAALGLIDSFVPVRRKGVKGKCLRSLISYSSGNIAARHSGRKNAFGGGYICAG